MRAKKLKGGPATPGIMHPMIPTMMKMTPRTVKNSKVGPKSNWSCLAREYQLSLKNAISRNTCPAGKGDRQGMQHWNGGY